MTYTGSQEIRQEASSSVPCPLCERDHYCYLFLDVQGQVFKSICQWTDHPPEGWDRVGTAKDNRGIFCRQGYNRSQRRTFPDYLTLSPRDFGDIPQWQPTDPGDRPIIAGDLVLFHSGVPEGVWVVVKTRGGKHQGQHQILVTVRRPDTHHGGMEVPESDLAIATTDPTTGAVEHFIEYHYHGADLLPLGKVVRTQWTDRRRAYEKFRKSKQIRPYHWLGSQAEGFWSSGKGDRPWPLYREIEAKDEILRGGVVFAVAGEQAVETYRAMGLVATSCQGGESNFKDFIERLEAVFQEAKGLQLKPVLVIHPDHDLTGETKFAELLKECEFKKIPAVMLEPLDLWNELPPGGDIWDVVNRSGMNTATILQRLEGAVDEAIDRQEGEIFARQQRERWQAPEVYRGELGYWREDKETGKRYFRPQADFDFQVERELISEDGGGLVLQIKRTDDSSQRRVYIKSAEYSSTQLFTNALKRSLGGGVVCNLSSDRLQALIRVRLHEYRTTRRGKAYRLIDRIGQQPDGCWVFEHIQFTKHGESTNEDRSLWVFNPEITGNNAHFKPPAIPPHDPGALPKLVAAMQRAFGSNFAPAMLTLGYAAAACHYQEIQEKEGAFPILNLYGDPGSGKTTAAECALSLVGQHKEGMMVEVSVSAAYERLKLAGGLLHCLDDPKRDELLDEFLKGFYNAKARVVRGKDAAGFNTQKPHSPLMVTSNHACGENSAATQSRLVRLFFPKTTDGDGSAFRELPRLQEEASACFTDLVKLGYPAEAIYELEQEIAEHVPNAHLRIAKSLALVLCYAMRVAALAGIDGQILKDYVMNVVAAQVNDPDESGDSLRDFLEKVFTLESEAKIGEWNFRWVEKKDGDRALTIYMPGVWAALDKNFKVSYNKRIIEALLQSKGLSKTRGNFDSDEDQSRHYKRMKLTMNEESLADCKPERTTRWCYELPASLLKEYSEKSGSSQKRSSRSSADFEEPQGIDTPSEEVDDLKDHQRSSEIIKAPTPENAAQGSDDLFAPVMTSDDLIDHQPQPQAEHGVDASQKDVMILMISNTPTPQPSFTTVNNPSASSGTPEAIATEIAPGDFVVISASGSWIKAGSDRIEWNDIPHGFRDRETKEVPLSRFEDMELLQELTDRSLVIGISEDGKRVRVRNCTTNRISVFGRGFVHLIKKGGS